MKSSEKGREIDTIFRVTSHQELLSIAFSVEIEQNTGERADRLSSPDDIVLAIRCAVSLAIMVRKIHFIAASQVRR